MDAIFGTFSEVSFKSTFIEKTLSGDFLLSDFNEKFNAHLEYEDAKDFNDLVTLLLNRRPVEGDRVKIDKFEIIVKEVTLIGIKKVVIKTI